jgi:hypothetical protein
MALTQQQVDQLNARRAANVGYSTDYNALLDAFTAAGPQHSPGAAVPGGYQNVNTSGGLVIPQDMGYQQGYNRSGQNLGSAQYGMDLIAGSAPMPANLPSALAAQLAAFQAQYPNGAPGKALPLQGGAGTVFEAIRARRNGQPLESLMRQGGEGVDPRQQAPQPAAPAVANAAPQAAFNIHNLSTPSGDTSMRNTYRHIGAGPGVPQQLAHGLNAPAAEAVSHVRPPNPYTVNPQRPGFGASPTPAPGQTQGYPVRPVASATNPNQPQPYNQVPTFDSTGARTGTRQLPSNMPVPVRPLVKPPVAPGTRGYAL